MNEYVLDEKGDVLILLGFSRGAYFARVIARFIYVVCDAPLVIFVN